MNSDPNRSLFQRSLFRCVLAGIIVLTLNLPPPSPADAAENLVLYSGRKEKAIKPVTEAFTKATGIRVAQKIGKTSGLANEIRMEKAHPRGDLFVSTEGGIMEILAKEGLLDSYTAPVTKTIPEEFRSATGAWTGISGRARIILYNQNLVTERDVPKSVFELTDPRWKGKLSIASTRERTTLAWVSTILAEKGEAFTREYIKGLMANGIKILADNTEVWQGVGRGEFAIGLTNSPNYYLAKKMDLPVGVVYPDQGPSGFGTPVSPNAVAVIKGASNPDAARRFIDFVLSPQGQRILVTADYEIPFLPGADTGEVVPLKSIKRPGTSEQRLAELAEPTLKLLTQVSPDW